MNQVKIKDKNNIDYVVEVIKGSLKKEIVRNCPKWSAEYRVKNQVGEEIGFGHFNISCLSGHEHLADEKIFSALIKIGATKIKNDIDNGEPIESKRYNMNVNNCLRQ